MSDKDEKKPPPDDDELSIEIKQLLLMLSGNDATMTNNPRDLLSDDVRKAAIRRFKDMSPGDRIALLQQLRDIEPEHRPTFIRETVTKRQRP
ncbi:MAG: hypothetical protein H0V24_14280 [Chloroflexia bacterium]|nr:hypothetical protein [Chloroflexia bacterium]MDQ3412371.1 hypothetical protein [Chloroflexota bacterium]